MCSLPGNAKQLTFAKGCNVRVADVRDQHVQQVKGLPAGRYNLKTTANWSLVRPVVSGYPRVEPVLLDSINAVRRQTAVLLRRIEHVYSCMVS